MTIEPKDDWTRQEKWVWGKLCAGEEADLNEYDPPPEETVFDPKNDEDFKDDEKWKKRIISSDFLETVLLDEPYKGALTRKGVTIFGAWVKDKIDLSFAVIKERLGLMSSRFDSYVDLASLNAEKSVSFNGSTFKSMLFMNSVQINGNLFMRNGAQFTEVELGGAIIGGQLTMNGSTFKGELNMNSLQVSNSLFMSEGAEFNEVDLKSSYIGGLLNLTSATFRGKLAMENVKVESHILLQISTCNASVNLVFAKIKGGLVLAKSQLNSLDLTGTVIEKDLSLGWNKDFIPKWIEGARLTLRNTKAGALVATKGSWPEDIDLAGFKYSRLGGLSLDGEPSMDIAKIKWFGDWLKKQKTFSPQPYEQLASVLREEGHEQMARDILYAKRERQRLEEPHTGWRTVFLWLMEYVIGHGYRIERVRWWVLGFILFGAFILYASGEGAAHGMPYGFSYSLDMLLPLVELRELHYGIDLGTWWARYYFYFHKVVGYALASFLIAGLSGLTK